MYSGLTNEEATVLPFILHHQNKLNNAHDCCGVSLSTILLEKASPVNGQVFRKCQNVIQGIHKRMVRFRELIRNLFLTLHGQNVHRQQRQLSKFLMRYQQFASHA